METLLVLLVILLLLALLLGPLAFFMANAQRTRIAALERQVRFLKDQRAKAAPRAAEGMAVPARPQPSPEHPATELPATELSALTPAPAPARLVPLPEPAPAAARAAPSGAQALRPARPEFDLENLLGARASVWIGGLALLLGAVFLLRYTIEAGLLTPAMRVGLAVLMGAVALAASEWLARSAPRSELAQRLSARADIPSLLAGVGVFSLFGAAYAAHALYGFLGATSATLVMGAVGVGSMALALRRGPWLAGAGLLGALATPLLVASVTPSFVGVWAYVAIITAAALWVARRQAWSWLTLAAAVGATFWLSMLVGKSANIVQLALWTLGWAAVLALCAVQLRRARVTWQRPLGVSAWARLAGWAGVAVLCALAASVGDDLPPTSRVLPFAAFAAALGLSQWSPRWNWPGVVIAAGVLLHPVTLPYPLGLSMPGMGLEVALITALGAALIIGLARSADAAEDHKRWPAMLAIAAGTLALLAVTHRLHAIPLDVGEAIDRARAFNDQAVLREHLGLGAMLLLSALSGGLAWRARQHAVSGALLIVAALGVGVAATFASSPSSGVAVLSFGAAGLAAVLWRRDTPLGRFAPIGPLVVAGVTSSLVVGVLNDAVTGPVLFNTLWLWFALPGGVAAVSGWMLSRRRVDMPAQVLLGAAIVFSVLFLAWQIQHAATGGDIRQTPGFVELSAQFLAAFAALLGGSWVRGGLTDWPGRGAPLSARVVPGLLIGGALVSLAGFAAAQLVALNPLFNPATPLPGRALFNPLLLGFLLPAVLLGAAALRYSGRRPSWFVRALGALSGVSALMWVTAEIRRAFHGAAVALDDVPWNSAELYAVSAAWLAVAVGLLFAGLRTGRRDLRIASAALMVATTLKVFLVDMAQLDGALRAASFIGLGVVLLGIGRLYQRVLASERAAPETGPA